MGTGHAIETDAGDLRALWESVTHHDGYCAATHDAVHHQPRAVWASAPRPPRLGTSPYCGGETGLTRK